MKLKTGYYQLFDLVLAFRQICERERFHPFIDPMNQFHARISEQDRERIDEIGQNTRQWLHILEFFIDRFSEGVITPEDFLSRSWEGTPVIRPEVLDLLKRYWICAYLPLYAARASQLAEQALKIAGHKDMTEYLCSLSDRFERISPSSFSVSVQPRETIDLEKAESVVIQPSIFASRTVTFWHSRGKYLFFVRTGTAQPVLDDPPESLSLSLAALNDKTRLKLLKLLIGGQTNAVACSKLLGITPSTVSRHLQALKDSWLIEITGQEGNTFSYSASPDRITKVFGDLCDFLAIKGTKQEAL